MNNLDGADEGMWAQFYAPEQILEKLGLSSSMGDVVEFGCHPARPFDGDSPPP